MTRHDFRTQTGMDVTVTPSTALGSSTVLLVIEEEPYALTKDDARKLAQALLVALQEVL